ncbi:MAG: DUF3060 domain-containing protein [Alphaproteobacteria bacterium]|nr:DUF3060 domain-containing protein [Alphaproteobacteria bacterium]MBV9863438.1 DUF3060 domain-containing protein [Alphaproteobacteria bacterium]
MRRGVLIAVVAAGLAGGAQARDPVANFAGSNETFSGNCQGQDANLSGSDNTVTIRGGCRYFQIAGNDNRVLVEMASDGVIKVFGENNHVSWTGPGEVVITKMGPGNVIVRGH